MGQGHVSQAVLAEGAFRVGSAVLLSAECPDILYGATPTVIAAFVSSIISFAFIIQPNKRFPFLSEALSTLAGVGLLSSKYTTLSTINVTVGALFTSTLFEFLPNPTLVKNSASLAAITTSITTMVLQKDFTFAFIPISYIALKALSNFKLPLPRSF